MAEILEWSDQEPKRTMVNMWRALRGKRRHHTRTGGYDKQRDEKIVRKICDFEKISIETF